MRGRIKVWSAIASVFLLLIQVSSLSAASSQIEGVVTDVQTKEPLFGANVMLIGSALGAASDMYGKYNISNVPAGTYILRATYIGYKEQIFTIDIVEGKNYKQDFVLEYESLEGETVIVTAQAMGQNSAINQQLTAKTIMNVVSSARIQELPDANAAESVGRLPGISIQRSGGEGNKLVVRGLQPKYNVVMVNGVRMSPSNPDDRSVDLSMISPYMLDGIEVSKNVTPDQDADVLGGTINFRIKKAGGANKKAGLALNLLSQGGYTGLSNAYNKFNNYKFVGSLEGRFLDGSLGVFAQADYEKKNLTSNELNTTFEHYQRSQTQYQINNINLHNIPRDRERVNGTLVLDYQIPQGSLSLTNFFSSGITTTQDRGETFDILYNNHDYSFNYSKSTLNMITNSLNFEKEFDLFKIDARISHTYSETDNPEDYRIIFRQRSAINNISQFLNKPDLDPRDIPKAANNQFSNTYLNFATTNDSFFKERALVAALDVTVPYPLTREINSEFKFGGKIKKQTRNYSRNLFDGQGLSLASARIVDDIITSQINSASDFQGSTSIPITAFTDSDYDYGKFLDGDYTMVSPLNSDIMSELANLLRNNADYISENNGSIAYGKNNFESTSYNYSGNELVTALYGMTTINIGGDFDLIAGVRYQSLRTEYTGSRGIQSSLSYYEYSHYDTTVTETHAYWLPSVVVRYKPLSWFDVRLACTNTLSYPDFNAIIPRIDVGNGFISWNNHTLKPSRSTNYDIYLSFYENKIGLFTVGGFYKQITDLIYADNFFASRQEALQYFPPALVDNSTVPSGTYKVTTYVNNPYEVDLWGIELDWQTHFWYLPAPFNGLVLNVNYTHTFSEAEYPYTDRIGGWVTTYVDTSFTDRLLSQPNDIVNLSVGYDYKDFSIRVSMLHQADIFAGVSYWEQLRTTTAAYTRWDISLKQTLPWYGLQVYGILNNVGSEKDSNVLQMYPGLPQTKQSYGMTATLGIRWSM
ncbi:MAG: TonB-dependent receptor [Bacteroidetes bacterium]|nr:TonB-dependent receptor [Bacteroidota bacterium]